MTQPPPRIANRIRVFHPELPLDQIRTNPKNWKVHPSTQRAYLRTVLEQIGFAGAALAYDDPEWGLTFIDGHMRLDELRAAGWSTIPTLVLDVTRDEADLLLATYDPLGQLYESDQAALENLRSSLDPSVEAAELRALAERDPGDLLDLLDSDIAEGAGAVVPPSTTPIDDAGVQDDSSQAAAPAPDVDPDTLPPSKAHELDNRLDALVEQYKVKKGQLWLIPSRTVPNLAHRIYVGDSQRHQDVRRLVGGERWPALVVMDPPYSSGGFQEAGRSAGSVGTKADVKRVAGDTLSTRGYTALLNKVLDAANAAACYVFTDWRMWVVLHDIAEGQRYGVRQMIVWDKGTPGMGQGWRSQHELILLGMRQPLKFDPHKAVGNVIRVPRTGNQWHTTQKPVELVRTILDTTPYQDSGVYDPMLGSGTTLLAAERAGWVGFGMEQDPAYVAATLHRLANDAGLEPRLATGSPR